MHLLLTFKNGKSEDELVQCAKKKGIRVYGMSAYRIRKKKEAEAIILLGYANMTEVQIKEAVKLLRECWNA